MKPDEGEDKRLVGGWKKCYLLFLHIEADILRRKFICCRINKKQNGLGLGLGSGGQTVKNPAVWFVSLPEIK